MHRFCLMVLFTGWWATVGQAQVIVVGWGGNSVSQSQDFTGFSAQTTLGGVNLNAPARDNRLIIATDSLNNDGLIGIPYSATTQLSPTSNYSGQRFYGGVAAGLTGLTSGLPTIDRLAISNSGNDDVLDFRFSMNNTAHDAHLMVFFQKSDFLNGGNSPGNRVEIVPASSLSVRFNANTSSQVNNDGEFRWILRDNNNQWWISAKDSTGRPNIRSKGDTGSGGIQNNTTYTDSAASGDLTYWASFDPTTGSGLLGLNFEPAYSPPTVSTAASYVIAPGTNPFIPKTFTDVTALGMYVEGDQFATNVFQFEIAGLTFSAAVVPELTSWSLILGAPLLLASLWYLRRRPVGTAAPDDPAAAVAHDSPPPILVGPGG